MEFLFKINGQWHAIKYSLSFKKKKKSSLIICFVLNNDKETYAGICMYVLYGIYV